MKKNIQLEIYKELENTFKEMYLNLANANYDTAVCPNDLMNPMIGDHQFVNEEETDKEIKDEKLEQILSDLGDNAQLLLDKFRELKENEVQIKKANYDSNSDEYSKIQKQSIIDSMLSIKTTLINLGRLYQYYTKYITKYGFKDINAKQENTKLDESDKYDYMRYYPDSKLNPLVQRAIKSEFDELNKYFHGITDINCKYDDNKRTHTIFFTYKGKKYSFRLDLNGDTRTYVNKMVKRLIAPKPTKVSFVRTYR